MELDGGGNTKKKFQGSSGGSNNVSLKRKAEDEETTEIPSVEDIHISCTGQVCKFPYRRDCKDPSGSKRSKLSQIFPGASFGSGSGQTLFASSLNSQETTVRSLHVERQQRFVIHQRISKVTTNRDVTVVYTMKCESSEDVRTLCLKNMWTQNDWLYPGTVVNLVDVKPNSSGMYTVDRCEGFLIVEPDKLVSVTSVIGQLYCERKVALSRCSSGGDSMVTFRGVVAHELICDAMVNKYKTDADLFQAVRSICERPAMLERAYGIGLGDEDVGKIKTDVVQWVGKFMRQRFIGRVKKDPKYQNFEFLDVLGIEDNIWNPTYGLKGKIDATMLIEKDSKRMVVPLEFKTGSTQSAKRQAAKADHIGQVTLYTLMMTMKFGKIEEALLYYISDDQLSCHTPRMLELQQLIIFRNSFIRNTTLSQGQLVNLPRPDNIDFDFKCKNCEVRNICTLNIAKDVPLQSLSRTEKSLVDACSLSKEELKFFDDWLFVINSETEDVEKKFTDKGIWKKSPEEREKNGTCVANLKLKSKTCTPFRDSNLRNLFLVTFSKPSSTKALEYCLHVDDFVAVSSNVEVNINYAVVYIIRKNDITLAFDQPFHAEYFESDFIYAIDKINTTSPIASQYGYLAKMMEPTEEAGRLRDYIINKKIPKYETIEVPTSSTQNIVRYLNVEQKRVVFKALATDSFLFVQGSPGSGKTATIVCLLRALVESGKSVLVVAYTGTALENILLRYAEHSTNFIRISSSSKSESKLAPFTTKELCKGIKTIQGLKQAYNKPVVSTTLLSLKHAIFQNRRFDYCIVDEASQALPTAVFGALLLCDKYIVFGDPNQLPPVMTSSALKTRNLSDNFFSLMATPESTIKMNLQYRMNRCINGIANGLMYENQMVCGSAELERAYIQLPEEKIRAFLKTQVTVASARRVFCHVVSKKREKAVMFLDTCAVSAVETQVDSTIVNEAEKNLVLSCTRMMVECGISPEKIGLITPYRGQVKLIRGALKEMLDERFGNVEVNTVDQYQGREMDVIICSFVKSNGKELTSNTVKDTFKGIGNKAGTLDQPEKESILEDIRRLNVAITRARVKLVLIGNRQTLARFAPFRKLFELLTEEQVHQLSEEEFNGICNSYLAYFQENNENVVS